jgi:hypothetical protein
MNRHTKFTLLLTLLITGRFFDMYTTYLYIPDLQGETNVLVSWLGAGWFTVIFIHLVIIAAITYALYYYCYRFVPVIPAQRNLNLRQYISWFHFNSPDRLKECFYRIPHNKGALLGSLGFVVPLSLIVISFMVGLSTTMLINSPGYRAFYGAGGIKLLFGGFFLVVAFFYVLFFRRQYSRYRNS